MGIRVTAVAPGVIKTPLWTDNPEKLRLVQTGDVWVTPEYVADTMVALVEEEDIEVSTAGVMGFEDDGKSPSGLRRGESRHGTRIAKVQGGIILEIAKGRRRIVEQFNDPGPSGEGNTVSGMRIAEEEIFDSLKRGWGRF